MSPNLIMDGFYRGLIRTFLYQALEFLTLLALTINYRSCMPFTMLSRYYVARMFFSKFQVDFLLIRIRFNFTSFVDLSLV